MQTAFIKLAAQQAATLDEAIAIRRRLAEREPRVIFELRLAGKSGTFVYARHTSAIYANKHFVAEHGNNYFFPWNFEATTRWLRRILGVIDIIEK